MNARMDGTTEMDEMGDTYIYALKTDGQTDDIYGMEGCAR